MDNLVKLEEHNPSHLRLAVRKMTTTHMIFIRARPPNAANMKPILNRICIYVLLRQVYFLSTLIRQK